MTNDTITPVRPPREPRRRPRWRTALIIAGLVLGAFAVLGAVLPSPAPVKAPPAVISASPAATHAASAPPSAPAVPATTAPAVVSTPAPDPGLAVYTWWIAGGQDDVSAVTSDLDAIGTDATAENLIAVEDDGMQLTADAQAALADPPPAMPGFSGKYTAAMRQLVLAGQDMTAGRIDAATVALQRGTADISQATAAVQAVTG